MRTLAGYVDPSCGMGDHQLLTAPVMQKLGAPSPNIRLVSSDPEASARAAARFLPSRGYQAHVVLNSEPARLIAFAMRRRAIGARRGSRDAAGRRSPAHGSGRSRLTERGHRSTTMLDPLQ
jgi:hypothetical protein